MIERLTYSIKEYAAMLGFTPQTVVVWMEKQKIPGEKIEGRWIIRKPEVDEWFSRQRLPQEQEAVA